MIQLYEETPISIFKSDHSSRITLEFCNITMKMKPCQFIRFNNYLDVLEKKIQTNTNFVTLRLVLDDLTVKISLNDFLQLNHGVQTVISKTFKREIVLNN